MKTSPKSFFLLFWLTTIIHIGSIFLDAPVLGYVTKPFLMIFLALAYLTTLREGSIPIKKSKLVFIALFFSFLGDIFLMIPGGEIIWFLLGVLVFMVAQLCYVAVYLKFNTPTKLTGKQHMIRSSMMVIVFLYMVILWTSLRPVLGELLLPVSIYTVAISAMAFAAIVRFKGTSLNSFIYVLSGALIFIASDSMIAINKFLTPIEGERFLIMTTYIIAQYLIIRGLIYHIKAA